MAQDLYRNMDAPTHERILDLLSKLTPEEKVSLLHATSPGVERLGIDKYYMGNEALHGIIRPGKFTVFPQAIGLASMWNSELHHEIATVISDEARARWNELERGKKQKDQFSDLLTFWSPTVNMARDPRWGRTPETYGEDPYLSGELGAVFVKGLQGNDPVYLKVVATPKHFAANNEEHNRFECDAIISETDLREYYFPAFEKCIREGKAESIMTAYNAINGVPSTANNWLLQKVLRQDWGFGGYVVSDCGAPGLIMWNHHYVKTPELAATLTIKAGLDVECGDYIFIDPLLSAHKQYMISIAEIDSAAYHVLRARMRLGMFDDPKKNPYNQLSPEIVGCKRHQELALEAARQSIVLLKNQKNRLPLNAKKIKSIAVVGINSANCEFGDYSGTPVNAPVSVLEGIRNRVGDRVKVVHAPWVSSEEGYQLIPSANLPDGLHSEYFDNPNLSGAPKTRIDKEINFEPKNQAPDPFLPKSPLSIRWTGELMPGASGEYVFSFTSDDGCRLYLDDKLIIDDWNVHSAHTEKASVTLEKGKKYQLKAEYFDNGGDAVARLHWHVPSIDSDDMLSMYGEASKAIRECDVVVAVMGINQSIEREGQDRTSIELPKDQQIFIREAYKANPNTIVVLVAGSSLAIGWMDQNIPAIIDAWYPGEQGGTAIAEVLFGDYNPAGRLPLTFYNSIEELPAFNDYNVKNNRTYMYFENKPLYAFGYGLSYTQFNYRDLSAEQDKENVTLTFSIKNSGKYDGDEVAQAYVQFPEVGVKTPVKQLKGFKRIHIKKGATEQVRIIIPKKELRLWNDEKKQFYTPSGTYNFMIGKSSDNICLQRTASL
jgi:beta-glucosidase